ncbi:ribonuclease HI, partial [Rhizoctonia solani AG-3 Rhs1AP]
MHGGKVGAAAVMMREDGTEVTSRLHIGSDEEHEVYEAEVYGLLMGLELLSRERGLKDAAIFIDNQAVLRALQGGKTQNLGHAYARLEMLLERVRRMNGGIRLATRWVPGHMDVDGNEKADEAAKRAAEEEDSTTYDLLPEFLKRRVPTNPSAAKRTRRRKMNNEWREYVGETERTERMRNTQHSSNFDSDTSHWQPTFTGSRKRSLHDAHIANQELKHPSIFSWDVGYTTNLGESETGRVGQRPGRYDYY